MLFNSSDMINLVSQMTAEIPTEICVVESPKYVYTDKSYYNKMCIRLFGNGYGIIYVINIDFSCSHENTKKAKKFGEKCALCHTRVWKFWKTKKCLGKKLRSMKPEMSSNDIFFPSQRNPMR